MKITPWPSNASVSNFMFAAVIAGTPFVPSARLMVLIASPVRSDNSETERLRRPRAARSCDPVITIALNQLIVSTHVDK